MSEQLLIDILFFIIYDLFNCTFIYIHLICTLTPKYNKWLILVGCSAANWIIGKLLTEFADMPLRFICSILAVVIPALLFFKDSWQKKLLSSTIQIAAFMSFDALAAMLAVDYFGFMATQEPIKNWACVMQAIVFNGLSAFILGSVIIIWRKFVNNLHFKSMSLFIIFPLGQVIALCGYYNHLWETIEGVEKINPFLIISILVFSISDVFMLAALRENSRVTIMKEKVKDMEHQIELQYQYYENLSNQFTEIKEYRHDIKNLISAADMVINDEASKDIGKEMLSSLKERAESLSVPLFCRNPIVNAIIWQKSRAAKEHNIDFIINIKKDDELALEKNDICSVIANLLDNAIREAEKHNDSFIEISAKTDIGMVFVEVKNTTDVIFSGEGLPETTKSDNCHGYGLEIVDKIAKKYNGSFVFSSDGKVATASFGAMLKNTSKAL